MKLVSWNVNGFRAVLGKGFSEIFDNFDAISNDKILGLQAEIILRHKQYEYYRDLLLTFERTECHGYLLNKQSQNGKCTCKI